MLGGRHGARNGSLWVGHEPVTHFPTDWWQTKSTTTTTTTTTSHHTPHPHQTNRREKTTSDSSRVVFLRGSMVTFDFLKQWHEVDLHLFLDRNHLLVWIEWESAVFPLQHSSEFFVLSREWDWVEMHQTAAMYVTTSWFGKPIIKPENPSLVSLDQMRGVLEHNA